MQQAEILMAFFENPKHKKKKLKMCMTTFWDSKLNLIQWLDEEDWIKSMCIKYIMYIFSMTIRLHVCDS